MSDWSGALARAFRRHLEEEESDTGSAGSSGSRAQKLARRKANDADTSPEIRLVPVVPNSRRSTDDGTHISGWGTTGTTGTTQAILAAEALQDAFEERAAIIEYDASVSRSWAEGFARLIHGCRPEGIDDRTWHQLIDDGGRFLDRWGEEACRLGWSALDVFGVRLAERSSGIGIVGLVRLIGGGEVVSIAPDRATIQMKTGGTVTYLRQTTPGTTVIWDLLKSDSEVSGSNQQVKDFR